MRQLENGQCPDCADIALEQNPHHMVPGTVLKEKYLIGHSIGAGGFGITYIGRDLVLDTLIAIKEYYPSQFSIRNSSISPDVTVTAGATVTSGKGNNYEKSKERFLDEARILARFEKDAGIVNVRDFFEANNTAYIVMEYIDGLTLKEHLEQNGTFSPAEIVAKMRPVMESLARVHEQGLVHRDISPDNIKMPSEGNLKLLDFGAARFVAADLDKTVTNMTKAGYAPEEQYRSGGEQGPWSDIYALCSTIYKCITGVTPPDAPQRLHNKTLNKQDVAPPSLLGANINTELEAVILRGMSVLQGERFQSMSELLAAIDGKEYAPVTGGGVINVGGENNDDERLKREAEEKRIKNEEEERQKSESENRAKCEAEAKVKNKSKDSIKNEAEDAKSNESKKSTSILKRWLPAIVAASIVLVGGAALFIILGGNNEYDPVDLPPEVTAPDPTPIPTPPPEIEPEQTIMPVPGMYVTILGENFSTSLTELDLSEKGLRDEDIVPLQHMVNLTRLLLGQNQISDLAPLSELTNLTELSLVENQISDLAPLSELTNLTALGLRQNKISDLTPLSELTNLTALGLFQNEISDLSPLRNLTNLTSLLLFGNEINDLTPLSGLSNLTDLILSNNQISDLTPLSGLSNLVFLNLVQNQINDLAPLSNLTNLSELFLSLNHIRDLTPLSELSNLAVLHLGQNQIMDLTPLSGLSNLAVLWFSTNQVFDLIPLSGLSNLSELSMGSNRIYDLTPLSGLSSLTSISANINRIIDLEPLSELIYLTELRLAFNQIVDLTPLSGLYNLSEVELDSNQITDWSPVDHIAEVLGRP